MSNLVIKLRISRKTAQNLIITMAKYGDHSHRNIRFNTDADVKRFYKINNIDFESFVETCRDFSKNITFFENLIGSTWHLETEGSQASVAYFASEEIVTTIDGPGTIINSTYQSQFETAIKTLRLGINEKSFQQVLNAVVLGITSIESYVNYRVQFWNATHSNNQLIDNRNNKVSFDDKIDEWFPIMTSKRLDKSTIVWSNYKILRAIRDDYVIHAKNFACGATYAEIADTANKYKTGIAQMLFELHLLFNEPVPSKIIRAMFSPEVIVE